MRVLKEGGGHLSLVYDTADDYSVKEEDDCHPLVDQEVVTSIGIEFCKREEAETTISITSKTILHTLASYPSLTRLSLTSSLDHTGKHALRISELAETLQHCPNLKDLQLQGVGFSIDHDLLLRNDERGPWEQLKQVMDCHRNIASIEFNKIYFVQQNRPDSWLLYSQLVQAISASPTLTSLSISSTKEYFSRPILTLSALQSLLSHGRLQRLFIHHFHLWGAGSALHCAEAIRHNTVLTDLALTACVFAAADHHPGDQEHVSSLLSGFDTNRSIRHLDVTASMLPLEYAGLSAALLKNKSLESLTLNRTRMALDSVIHGGRLCRILKSISCHPCLRELHLVDAIDIPFPSPHKIGDSICDASFIGLRAFLHAVRDAVAENSIIHKVTFDPIMVKDLLENNICIDCATAISQIGILTGLNRAQYWDLTPETSSSQQWVDGLARVANSDGEEERILTSTIFHIVSSNPLVCSIFK